MPSPDERLRLLERWRDDHEALHRREKSELLDEVADMNAAAIRHVEKAVGAVTTRVEKMDGKIDQVLEENKKQSGMLEAAAELRARRSILEEKKTEAEIKQMESEARNKRWLGYAAVGTVLAGVITAIIKAIVSH